MSPLQTRLRWHSILLRATDAAVSAIVLILAAPVLGVAAAAILLDDGRPVLFRQTRIGRHGKPFLILKLRSMRNNSVGQALTVAGDRRVTRTGEWLRKHKLDELPQFWNVLRGDMSLIGPRPEVPEYVQVEDPQWKQVLAVRPGITDPASLLLRNEEGVLGAANDPETYYRTEILPAKLRLNAWYQRSRTLGSDVKLLWLTARYSFWPKGFDWRRVARALAMGSQSPLGLGKEASKQ